MDTILVVDDQVIGRQVLCHFIQSANTGCNVIDFACPREALAWLRLNAVRLVFTDHNMSAMTGIAFIEALRRHPQHVQVPVIMVTADDSPALKDRAIAMGVADFLVKPVGRRLCHTLMHYHLGLGSQL